MTTTSHRLVNETEVRRAYSLLVEPGQVVEVRVLDATTYSNQKWTATYSGYFDNVDALVEALEILHTSLGIYITLQPCKSDLIGRAYNRLKQQTKTSKTTSDSETTRYTWLPIDCDPERPAGISSTDEEHEQALTQARFIREELHKLGWSAPIFADSGNGAHLLYKIDLAVSDSDLVKRVLEGLAARFEHPAVHVDRTLFNPSRIIKLYGTLACKGDDISERPHRMSQLLEVPDEILLVSRKLLEDIAAPDQETMQTSKQKTTGKTSSGTTSHNPDTQKGYVEAFLKKHNIPFKSSEPYQGGTRYRLEACAWDSSHTDTSACVYEFPDHYGASCSHNSCHGKGWKDFRRVFEPDAYEKKPRKSRLESIFGGDEEETVALQLVKLAEPHIEVFCDNTNARYAKVIHDGHIETMHLTEKGSFRRWLHNLYEAEYESIPNSTALTDAIHTLEARAQFRTRRREQVYLRVAYIEETNTIYLDMANNDYQVIEITAQGWKVLDKSPVCFRRTGSMAPLPTPVTDGKLDELRSFINCSDEDWILIKAWLVGCLQPFGDGFGEYPVLNLNGGQGTAKTSAAQRLRSIIDPSIAPLRKQPKDAQAFAIMAHNNFVVGLDNLSHISAELSDSMCTLSTGAGDAYRKLYTDDEEAVFASKRPQVFTGIEQLVTRGDLLDRCILATLLEISEENRKDSTTLNAQFKQAHPLILGGLLDCVAQALKKRKGIVMKEKPRLADFAMFVVAAEPLIGDAGAFMEAYKLNREEGVASELEASPVASAIMKLMANTDKHEHTSTELMKLLEDLTPEQIIRSKAWPKSPRGLSSQLKRLARSLQSVELHVTFTRKDTERLITIIRIKKTSRDDANHDANRTDDANHREDDAKENGFASSQNDTTGHFDPHMTQNDAKFSSFCKTEKTQKAESNAEGETIQKNKENLRHDASCVIDGKKSGANGSTNDEIPFLVNQADALLSRVYHEYVMVQHSEGLWAGTLDWDGDAGQSGFTRGNITWEAYQERVQTCVDSGDVTRIKAAMQVMEWILSQQEMSQQQQKGGAA